MEITFRYVKNLNVNELKKKLDVFHKLNDVCVLMAYFQSVYVTKDK